MLTANLEAQTAKLVEQLAAPEFSVRDAAQRQLLDQQNILELRQYQTHPDLEVRDRVRYIISKLSDVSYLSDVELPVIWSLPADERYLYEWNEDYQTYDNDLAQQFYEEQFVLDKYSLVEMPDYETGEPETDPLKMIVGLIFSYTDKLRRFHYGSEDIARQATRNLIYYKIQRGATRSQIDKLLSRMRYLDYTGFHVKQRPSEWGEFGGTPPSVILSSPLEEGENVPQTQTR